MSLTSLSPFKTVKLWTKPPILFNSKTTISGTIPIPALWKANEFADAGPYDQWTMYIDFRASDSNVDISGVKFESVNAVVVGQTNRLVN